jgi:hypothetical protein
MTDRNASILQGTGALARILTPSPCRIALVALVSWSYSFLSGGTSYFHPNVEADRACGRYSFAAISRMSFLRIASAKVS